MEREHVDYAVIDAVAAAGCQTQLRIGDAENPIPALLVVRESFGTHSICWSGFRGSSRQH
jgi:hypothetical protein